MNFCTNMIWVLLNFLLRIFKKSIWVQTIGIKKEVAMVMVMFLILVNSNTSFAQCLNSTNIYYNNFNSTLGSGWSTVLPAPPVVLRDSLGPFGKETVYFNTTSGLEGCHDSIKISFRIIITGTWDGNGNLCCGPDTFAIKANGNKIYSTTFAQGSGKQQSYPSQYFPPPLTVANPSYTGTVINTPTWSVYDISFTFAHTGTLLQFEFQTPNSQGSADEPWYIDNFSLDICRSFPIPILSVTPSAPDFCIGSSATLNASGANSYTWSPSTGLNNTTGSTVIANPAINTIYTVTGSTPYCTITTSVPVNVRPKSFSIVDQTICEGQIFLGRTTGGTYIDTLVGVNGCDSIRTLNLTVKPRSYSTTNEIICEGQSFWGRSVSGVYHDTLVAANGCDSVRTLNLTVKPRSYSIANQIICEGQSFWGKTVSGVYNDTLIAVNGCDSIRTLNLTVKPRLYSTVTQIICEGQSFESRTISGVYIDTLVSVNGCDSVRTLNLTVKPRTYSFFNETICEGQSFFGRTFSGAYIDTLISATGCDSVRTLNLIVKPRTYSIFNEIICEGQSFFGRTISGAYLDTLISANGCDSVRTLNLTVKPRSLVSINESICEGQSFLGKNSTGIYIDTFVAANGCDSIRTLNLTVKPRSYSTLNINICEGQNFTGYTVSGTYVDTIVAANGCDSIRTINLTVKPKIYSNINATICAGEAYFGHTTSGVYVDTYTGSNGCDSIRTVNLKVLLHSYTSITQTICEGQSFLNRSSSGLYLDTLMAANGCDSIRLLVLTVIPRSYSIIDQSICRGDSFLGYNSPGTYIDTLTAASGCDSIRTLNLTVEDKPIFELGADRALCLGDSLVLFAGNYTSFLWQDNSTNATFTVKQPGYYSVAVTNSCGTVTDATVVTTSNACALFPNAFTPNKDGRNDEFKILNAFNVSKYKLRIYNRMGEVVFETTNYKAGWNGTVKGLPQQAGLYVYNCEYVTNNKPATTKGTFLLIR